VPGTKFAGLQYTYTGQGFPDPNNPQTVNIKQWIEGIGIGNPGPDLLSAFDKNFDASIGGLNTATEKMYNSERVVPLFEFRDLDPLKTTDFGSFMGAVDISIQALHQQFATQPARKIRVKRQSDGGSCVLSNTYTGNPSTPTTAAGGPDCGPNLGQIPCAASSTSPPSSPTSAAGEPDCGPNLGQIPCPTFSPSPPATSTNAVSSTSVSATTVQLPTASPPCDDVEECDEDENAARPS
jgi:hypothetical protein